MLRTQSDCFHSSAELLGERRRLGRIREQIGFSFEWGTKRWSTEFIGVVLFTSISRVNQRVGRKKCVYSKLAVMWSIEILQRSEKISVSDISAETMVFGWILKVHGNYRAVKISKMSRLKDLLLVLPGLALVIIGDSLACPSQCSCSSSGVVVDCSDRGLTQIPNNLPKDAFTL